MAINIESGSTWAEIRAHLNERAFDKNGDTLLGSISDINGNEALKIDSDNQKIFSYGLDGKSICGKVLAVEAGDFVVSIPKGMKRGICCIKTGERTSTSSGESLLAMIHFSTNIEESKLWGWHLDYGFSRYGRLASINSDYAKAYINDEGLNIHISSDACSGGNLNIYWEVW